MENQKKPFIETYMDKEQSDLERAIANFDSNDTKLHVIYSELRKLRGKLVGSSQMDSSGKDEEGGVGVKYTPGYLELLFDSAKNQSAVITAITEELTTLHKLI